MRRRPLIVRARHGPHTHPGALRSGPPYWHWGPAPVTLGAVKDRRATGMRAARGFVTV